MSEHESIRPEGEPVQPVPPAYQPPVHPAGEPEAAPALDSTSTSDTPQPAPSPQAAPAPQLADAVQAQAPQAHEAYQAPGHPAHNQPYQSPFLESPTAQQAPIWSPQAAGWNGQPTAPASGPGGAVYGVPGSEQHHGGQPPIWAPPPGSPLGSAPQPPRRGGRVAAIGAAALVLALGSGTIGAVTALGLSDDGNGNVPASSQQAPRQAAPVVDRSSLAEIAAKVQPSVVSIQAGNSGGSGVVLSADGFILTNNHVVAGAGRTANVTFSGGKTARGTVVGTDPRTDVAVIKVDGATGLTPAEFGDSDAMRVGDTVLALGSPFGLDGSVTSGIVSALNRTIQEGDEQGGNVTSIAGAIQTDAAINPGNSGGALVDLNGKVIGINTAIQTGGSGNGNIGLGFAIPSNKVKQVSDQLRKGETVQHAFLGVSVTPGEAGGAQIASIQPNSPAAAAGLKEGDVITKFGDRTINDDEDLVAAVQAHKVGDKVQVSVTRGGAAQTATVTLTAASD